MRNSWENPRSREKILKESQEEFLKEFSSESLEKFTKVSHEESLKKILEKFPKEPESPEEIIEGIP